MDASRDIQDRLGAIVAHAGLAENCIKKALNIINKSMMPYAAKQKADAWLEEARSLLRQIEEERKKIYQILKQEREGQG